MTEQLRRVLGIDWGRRRIGLAVSDELRISVRGLDTLERTNKAADLARIEGLIRDLGVGLLVVGRPLHMNGKAGGSVSEAEQFGRTLAKRVGLPVRFWDERLTSVEAERRLRGGRSHSKSAVDRAAAELILTEFLDTEGAAE